MVPYDIEEVTIDESVFYQYKIYRNKNISMDITNNDVIKTLKLEILNIKKKEKLNAGFEVNGILFDYDNNARIAYRELKDTFRDNPSFLTSWKASEGQWITMDAEMFSIIEIAGKSHISKIFNWLAIEQSKL